MKKIIIACLVLLPAFAFAQTTTNEEYLFVTKGYYDVLTKGTDMKQGYDVIDIVNGVDNKGVFDNHKIDVKMLRIDSTKKVKAVIFVVYNNNAVSKILCLPNYQSNTDLMMKFVNDQNQLTTFEKSVLINQMAVAYTSLISYAEQLEDKNKKPGN